MLSDGGPTVFPFLLTQNLTKSPITMHPRTPTPSTALRRTFFVQFELAPVYIDSSALTNYLDVPAALVLLDTELEGQFEV